ncbi:streptophobe family protein [Streptomyces sp. NRRL S-455]|uniref:streptophobe family protein n=1 Tax=Streptomyces sp. NRRL S-455 TaxID=1463908 RepID=UPI0005683164|nr:streptophobe family protein [Streptomyces sp. NRRL S-455]
MGAATDAGSVRGAARLPWGDVLMSAVAAVSWALVGMAGTAALGLRLLEADAAGSLGPMTAAVVALGAGGSVTPTGDVSAFGLSAAEADTAIEITPLGVSLAGALLLSYFFLRSLRAAGVVISPAELLARAGAVVALFVAMLGGLAWAGHDVVTIDGASLGLDDLTGGGGVEVPGLGDVGGLLPDRLGDLADARAAVGFTVDTAPTLLGGLGWSAGVLLIALLASRRTPLPRGWEAVHRVVRPAVSAVVTVLLVAVAAGLAAAVYAANGDDHPRRIAGAALLGAPNGVWLGVPIGLLVPWDGRATGELTRFLPDPLDDLLAVRSDQPVTLGRLAELDGRVWLLGAAAALMMLLAGVLVGVRTPVGGLAGAAGYGRERGSGGVRSAGAGGVAGSGRLRPEEAGSVLSSGGVRPQGNGGLPGSGALGFAGRCALRLGVATAAALPVLVWLTDVSVSASLSVLGFDAFGAGLELHGRRGTALLLGALWGAGAGAVGALLAWASGAAGRSAAALARVGWAADAGGAGSRAHAGWTGEERGAGQAVPGAAGTGQPGHEADAGRWATWTELDAARAPHREKAGPYASSAPHGDETAPHASNAPHGAEAGPHTPGTPHAEREAGPYAPGTPYRPPNPDTNPYLRLPEESRGPEDARPAEEQRSEEAGRRLGEAPWPRRTPRSSRSPRPGHGPPPGRPPQAGEAGPPDETRPGGEPGGPADGDVYGAPTVARPVAPPPRGPRQPPGPRGGNRPARPDDGPPPPPPPPPPRKPRGGR